MRDHDGQPRDGGPELPEHELERRVAELERRMVTMIAAIDAASRVQVAEQCRLDQDTKIAGGRLVRRILEKDGLIEDYRATRRTG